MSERLGSNIVDFSTYRARQEQALADVSGQLSVEQFAKVAGNEDTEVFSRKIQERYQRICDMRIKAGFDTEPSLDNEMLITLSDDNLFQMLTDETKTHGDTLAVSRHESGHAVVAGILGWHVKSITVVPNGYYLGLTESVPRSGLGFGDWLLESAAISYGGKIAAIMSGDKAGGIGADMASVAAKARLAVSLPGSKFSSEEAFMREAENIASRAIRVVGVSGLNKIANKVFTAETMAA